MEWLSDLLFKEGVAHAIAILGLTIAVGKMLGRIKIAGISFGVTWILFVGLFLLLQIGDCFEVNYSLTV